MYCNWASLVRTHVPNKVCAFLRLLDPWKWVIYNILKFQSPITNLHHVTSIWAKTQTTPQQKFESHYVPNILTYCRRNKNFYLHFSLSIICFLDQLGILYLHYTVCTTGYRSTCIDPHTLAWLQLRLITRLKWEQVLVQMKRKKRRSNDTKDTCINITTTDNICDL